MLQPAHANSEVGSGSSLYVLVIVLTIAVYVELKENRIPNWLTLSGMSAGLLLGYFEGSHALWTSLGGLAIGFGFFFIFYVFGGIGGGDVKLMGAAGALMGSSLILPALFYTAIIGAVLAIMMVIWRRDFFSRLTLAFQRLAFWRKVDSADSSVKSEPVIVPYGVAIAVGCLLALLVK